MPPPTGSTATAHCDGVEGVALSGVGASGPAPTPDAVVSRESETSRAIVIVRRDAAVGEVPIGVRALSFGTFPR